MQDRKHNVPFPNRYPEQPVQHSTAYTWLPVDQPAGIQDGRERFHEMGTFESWQPMSNSAALSVGTILWKLFAAVKTVGESLCVATTLLPCLWLLPSGS